MSTVDLARLRHLYVDEQLSIRGVAAVLHIDARTVHTALIRGRIARRQRWEQRATMMQRAAGGQLNEATLRCLYVIEQLSIREIAEHFDTCTATVHHALVAWNIPRRKRGRPDKNRQRPGSHEDYRVVEHAIEM